MQQDAETLERPGDLAGVSEAALKLGVNKSTISRQVKSGMITNYGTAAKPLVSIEGAKLQRAGNLDPALQRTSPSLMLPVQQTAFVNAKTQNEYVKGELAKLELADKLKQIIPRADAEDLFETFGTQIRERLAQRWHGLAIALAGKSASEIMALGEAADEALLSEIAGEIERDFGVGASAS
jgi:hypothetical protein